MLKLRAFLLFNEIAKRFVKCQREENIGAVLARNVLADPGQYFTGTDLYPKKRERERVTVVACPSQFGGRVMWKCSSRMDLARVPEKI